MNFLALLFDIAVILSIFRTNQRNNIFCMLVLFLSSSDCLQALNLLTLSFSAILNPRISYNFKMTAQFFLVLFTALSVMIKVATAVEKMLHINELQPRHRTVSLNHSYLILLICGVMALLTALSYTLFTRYGMYATFHNMVLISSNCSSFSFIHDHVQKNLSSRQENIHP